MALSFFSRCPDLGKGGNVRPTLGLKMRKRRGHLDLNQGPLDLQSNALPLSYTPRPGREV